MVFSRTDFSRIHVEFGRIKILGFKNMLEIFPHLMWGRGNGNRTNGNEIELMEIGLTCSKFLKSSCETELTSYFLKQELELI